jgi:hypothetical protein
VLSINLDDTTFFGQILENLKDTFAIGIQSQSRNHCQVQDFPNNHINFEFQVGLLYRDGF